MRVGIIQSNYIPWRGYFDFVDDVDVFVFYDDVPFGQGKKWRNRNQIKTPQGLKWLTVPLKKGKSDKLIRELQISYTHDWRREHVNKLATHYRQAPYLSPYLEEFAGILDREYTHLSELNIALCKWIMGILGIETETKVSWEFSAQGDKRTRPLNLLVEMGATKYLSGATAAPYTDEALFRANGIELEYKSYDYLSYPQLWGEFMGQVSVLDLIFNTGTNAPQYLKSQKPNTRVV